MEIIGVVPTQDVPVDWPAMRMTKDGAARPIDCAVQVENLLEVYVNDILTFELTCSAGNLSELVVGRLFTEGIVQSAADIDCLSVCEHAMRADVYLHDRTADLSRTHVESVPSCCTGNRTLNDFFGHAELHPVTPVHWSAAAVYRLGAEFEADKTSHARTKGSHSAYLADLEGNILALGEDIGRHNAFDKVVGWAIINDVDLSRSMLFTSGRVPTDMATKAVRSGIPVLISKAVATDKAAAIAREFGLTLICQATSGSFDVIADTQLTPESARFAG